MTASPLADNVGFQAWNMSKRISEIKSSARAASLRLGELLSNPAVHPEVRREALGLRTTLNQDVHLVQELWDRISNAMQNGDPLLIDQPVTEVAVIRNRGSNPELMTRVRALWGEGRVIPNARTHLEQCDKLIDGLTATSPKRSPTSSDSFGPNA